MTTLDLEQPQSLSQNSLFILDCLYCEEKCWDNDDDDDDDDDDDNYDGFGSLEFTSYDSSSLIDDDEQQQQQLNGLLIKEEKEHFSGGVLGANKMLVMEARKEGLEWMIRVNVYYNFAANTLVLGANYFDRFMVRFGFKKELPWMTQLVAVTCLSLASKIEETHVPLLLDFQVEHKQVFEAKVIQRTELLVLSTLEWKMNAVTPLSYFGHLIRKLNLKINFQWKILRRCESLILSAILDPRYMRYVPSVIAAATMVQTLKEIGLFSTLKHHNDTMRNLKLDKDNVEECYKFINELSSNDKARKRKSYYTSPIKSPNNVLDVVSVSSEDSSSSISLMKSPEPLTKKYRTVGP